MPPYLLAETSARVECPLSVAFQYAIDMENFGSWFPGVVSIKSNNDLPHGAPNKEYLEQARTPPRGVRGFIVRVKESRFEEFFATEGQLSPLLPRMEMDFRSIGDNSCQISWRMLSRNDTRMAKLALLPLAKQVVRRRARQGIARLKKNLELLATHSAG